MNEELNLHRLFYLYEAVSAGSVRAAADKLNVNASVVSRQIALLEKEVAATLIERSSRGVQATEVGALFMDFYRSHRSMSDDLAEKLRETRGMLRGHVSISLGAGFVSDLMGPPIQAFRARYPHITLNIETAGTNEVMRRVCDDDAHIGLVYHPTQENRLLSRAHAVQPLCAIVRAGHPLQRLGRPLKLGDVADFNIAMKPISFGTMQLLDMAARVEHVALNVSLTTNSSSVMYHYLRSQEAITFAPAFSIAQELIAGELVALPVDHPVLSSAEAHLVTRMGRSLPLSAQRLAAHLAGAMTAFQATA
ncbi:LysR family transcriptional regulator [Bordetella bronchiseptica]|uniref:LysR family transcriptional regulator n=1 Tax=Bordetella bronchiseptica TaxID=518 RepID=UPI00046206A3|nr:LysR family transcriptional regulator [Bordetella bronchiseptica]KDC45453.1 LysR substrate-binding domain protein [Bordetella bronchiseptica M85/00/2]